MIRATKIMSGFYYFMTPILLACSIATTTAERAAIPRDQTKKTTLRSATTSSSDQRKLGLLFGGGSGACEQLIVSIKLQDALDQSNVFPMTTSRSEVRDTPGAITSLNFPLYNKDGNEVLGSYIQTAIAAPGSRLVGKITYEITSGNNRRGEIYATFTSGGPSTDVTLHAIVGGTDDFNCVVGQLEETDFDDNSGLAMDIMELCFAC